MPDAKDHNLPRRRFVGIAAGGALSAGLHSACCRAPIPDNKENHVSKLSQDCLYTTSLHSTSLTGEAADRVAIRELVDAWAHCADRRLAKQQSRLFTRQGRILIYKGDPATHQPIAVHNGQSEILAALAELNRFKATTHFNGQSVIVVQGDRAVGESYCLAHQLQETGGQRTLQILSIRYQDDFVREGERWLFGERKLIIDWTDTRPSVE